jgi:hypothetical protein
MAKTNQINGTGILVGKELKELNNAKKTNIVTFKVNVAAPGAKEEVIEVKAIRNNAEAAQKILAEAPKENTRVSVWGSMSTYRKKGQTNFINASATGGVRQETNTSKPPFVSFLLKGEVTSYDESSNIVTLKIDGSYMRGETKVERYDDVELFWSDEDNAFDEELIGKIITVAGKPKEVKDDLAYDEGSGTYQPKLIVGPTFRKGSIQKIEDAPESGGGDSAEDY